MEKPWKVKSLDIRENIANNYYEPNLPYPAPPVKPRLQMKHTSIEVAKYANDLALYELEMGVHQKNMSSYLSVKHRLENEFKADAIEDCGLRNNKARHRALAMAQDRGRSGGLGSVLDELEELAILLEIADF